MVSSKHKLHSKKSIGKKYNISGQTASEIKHEKIHQKVNPKKPSNTEKLKKSNYIQENTIGQIKWLLNNASVTQSEIGTIFNVHRKTVSAINCEKRYQNIKPVKPKRKILNRIES